MKIPICLLALVSLTCLAYAEDPDDQAPTPAPAAHATCAPQRRPRRTPPKYDGFVFSGLVDGYLTGNLNHPNTNDGYDQLQNFNIINGQPELSLIKVTVDKSDSVIGFHFDVGTGETMRLIHAGDPAAIEHKGSSICRASVP